MNDNDTRKKYSEFDLFAEQYRSILTENVKEKPELCDVIPYAVFK